MPQLDQRLYIDRLAVSRKFSMMADRSKRNGLQPDKDWDLAARKQFPARWSQVICRPAYRHHLRNSRNAEHKNAGY